MIQSATIAKIRLWAEQFSAGAPPHQKLPKGKPWCQQSVTFSFVFVSCQWYCQSVEYILKHCKSIFSQSFSAFWIPGYLSSAVSTPTRAPKSQSIISPCQLVCAINKMDNFRIGKVENCLRQSEMSR